MIAQGQYCLQRTQELLPTDSIGVEAVNNKVILHRLEPKEHITARRRYGVAVSELIQFNNNKPLKIGDCTDTDE